MLARHCIHYTSMILVCLNETRHTNQQPRIHSTMANAKRTRPCPCIRNSRPFLRRRTQKRQRQTNTASLGFLDVFTVHTVCTVYHISISIMPPPPLKCKIFRHSWYCRLKNQLTSGSPDRVVKGWCSVTYCTHYTFYCTF